MVVRLLVANCSPSELRFTLSCSAIDDRRSAIARASDDGRRGATQPMPMGTARRRDYYLVADVAEARLVAPRLFGKNEENWGRTGRRTLAGEALSLLPKLRGADRRSWLRTRRAPRPRRRTLFPRTTLTFSQFGRAGHNIVTASLFGAAVPAAATAR